MAKNQQEPTGKAVIPAPFVDKATPKGFGLDMGRMSPHQANAGDPSGILAPDLGAPEAEWQAFVKELDAGANRIK